MPNSNKFHLTQSLLSSWQFSFLLEDGYDDFLRALYRKPQPPSDKMLQGIEFEHCVNSVLDGAHIPENHKWYKPVMELADYLAGSRQQVSVKRDIIVEGVCFELHGVLDFLRGGVIYDTKFSTNYHLNKYLDSPQHPMYFYLVPEARQFEYLSCDGKFLYRERYYAEDVTPIEITIRQFMRYLDRHNLVDTYTAIWNLETYYQSKSKKEGKK